MRLGVAGLGEMGLVHVRNLLALGGVRLVAVAAARPGRADEVVRELGGNARACGYAELFAAADVDAVVLAARSIDHADLAIEVLRQGKHLLLEKPGATTLAAHDRLRREAEAHPELVVVVAYHRRYDATLNECRRLVAEGAIGEPLVVLLTSRDLVGPVREDPRDCGGFLLDMACHDYDTACSLLGREPVEAYAARQALVHEELWGLGDLDNALVAIRFAGGGLATTHISRTCAYGHDVRCEIVGTEGSVLVGNAASRAGVTLVSGKDASAFPVDYRARFADAYRAELEAFVAACRGVGPRGPGLDEDRRAVAIGIAVRASAVQGKPLEVGVDWPWMIDR